MDIILIGAPGAGKGTQAEKLSQILPVRHIASGDLFQKALEEKTELGLKARTYVDLGELVPDELTIPMVMRHIEEPRASKVYCWMGFHAHFSKHRHWMQNYSRSTDRLISRSTSRFRVESY